MGIPPESQCGDPARVRAEKESNLVTGVSTYLHKRPPTGTTANARHQAVQRNLFTGHKATAAYGGVMKVVYTPSGFGQVSQTS